MKAGVRARAEKARSLRSILHDGYGGPQSREIGQSALSAMWTEALVSVKRLDPFRAAFRTGPGTPHAAGVTRTTGVCALLPARKSS